MMLTDLADVLRAAGLTVVEVDGWRTRGYRHKARPNGDVVDVRGLIVHHTATPWTAKNVGQDYPTLGTVRDGRSDVPGPLAQLGLGRSGTWYVIAAGFANHAGTVRDAAFGSSHTIGVEAEAAGTGDSRDWPAAQMESYARGVAALAKHHGFSVDRVRGHKEVCDPPGRKVDPSFDMDAFRARVVAPGAAPAPSKPAPSPAKPTGLTVDGKWGADTIRRLQAVLGTPVDGVVSRQPASRRAANPGLTSGWDWTGRTGDGGSRVIAALQKRLGITDDGKVGPQTISALQRHLGTPVDGVVSHPSRMVSALQARLNEGKI